VACLLAHFFFSTFSKVIYRKKLIDFFCLKILSNILEMEPLLRKREGAVVFVVLKFFTAMGVD
jgi:hypothetical protein